MRNSLFLGLDLAGSPARETGWAVMDEKRRLVDEPGHLFGDTQIRRKIEELCPTWIGIDAPLTLPQGKGGNYNSRRCDRELAKFGVSALSPALLGSLTFRGVNLARILRKEGYPFIEVYPRATQKILKIRTEGKKPTLRWRESLQKGLFSWIKGFPPRGKPLSAHILDAILCAYTAYCRDEGSYQEVGDEEGLIVVPKVEEREI